MLEKFLYSTNIFYLVCNCCWLTVYIVVVVLCVVILCVFVVLRGHYYFLLQMPDCCLEVSIRKVLRPAISTQVFSWFPCA